MPCLSSSNAQVSCLPEALRDHVREVDERLAVAREGLDRDPLVRTVMAAADGAELDGRYAGLDEADRVRGAVAAHRDALGRRALVDGLGERRDVRMVARDVGR